jgi:capsular exopolysaccharide synthesis family protein
MAYQQPDEQRTEGFGPQEFLVAIRRHKLYVIVTAAMTFATALFYVAQQTPVYQSTGQVLVLSSNVSPTGAAADVNMQTEATLAASPAVAAQAASILGYEGSPRDLLAGLGVGVTGETEILTFVYSDPEPQVAREGVRAFVEGYLRFTRERFADQMLAASQTVQQQIDALREELARTEAQIAAATDQGIKEQLQATAKTLQVQIVLLQQRGIQTQSSPAVGQIVQSASAPTLIDTRLRTLLLALFVGLSLGTGLALLAERFDDRLRGRQDLAARSAAPVLAAIPRLKGWSQDGEPVVATLSAPRSDTSEAYRTLRTGVLYAASHNHIKTVMVTSSEGAEGKTTTVANLAAVLGKAGKRVIVIVADLRKPRLERFFGLGDGASGAEQAPLGLTNVLAGEVSVEEALTSVPDVANVQILRSGPMAGNPVELLESNGMRDIVARLRDQADLILIDAAPVLGVSDALVLCRLADAVLLVADARRTRRTAVSQAREQLMQVNGRVIGSVLNNLDAKDADVYGELYSSTGAAALRPAQGR